MVGIVRRAPLYENPPFKVFEHAELVFEIDKIIQNAFDVGARFFNRFVIAVLRKILVNFKDVPKRPVGNKTVFFVIIGGIATRNHSLWMPAFVG